MSQLVHKPSMVVSGYLVSFFGRWLSNWLMGSTNEFRESMAEFLDDHLMKSLDLLRENRSAGHEVSTCIGCPSVLEVARMGMKESII